MKISYNWLKNYVDFVLTPKDLGEVLTGVGLETEDIIPFETIQGGLEGVVIGEVKECAKHPDADKLSVTKVDVGSGDLLQIVCGAPNVAAGQKVVVALVGATLYPSAGEKLQIKKAKIRGVESFGMICAEDEIGLNENHAGIMVLNGDARVGMKAAEYFKVERDHVLEIGLTPNRGDANSHIGVARDVAAALNIAYQSKVTFSKPVVDFKSALCNPQSAIQVEVKDTDACPRYSGLVISNLTVKDSPDWLKNKLKAIGVRAINNVVDVTNYVLHEYGQPLHAFDADKIRGRKVVVQKLKEGTVFRTLDEKDIKLSADDLMICDAERGMCIAGVFGGADSGVTSSTKSIFLESACFSPTSIRKTAARHNLRTDAATHFEKGTDPNITVEALKRAAMLITGLAGGEVSSDIIDIYPSPVPGWALEVSYDRMLRLMGFPLEKEIIKKTLTHLEIKIEKEEGDALHLFIPAFKNEVKREADIVEEIIRIYGYNSFALPQKLNTSLSFTPAVDAQKVENTVAELLTGAGFNEIWTNSITQSKFYGSDAQPGMIKLLNSQTSELDCLRTDLMASGLEVIAYNQNRKHADLRLYEFGKTYHQQQGVYTEQRHLGIWLTGKTADDNWLAKGEKYNFYHLKAYVLQVLKRLGHTAFENEYFESSHFGMYLKNETEVIAGLVSVSRALLQRFDIKSEVFYANLNWDYLLERSQFNKTSFTELPRYPAVRRDLAMILSDELKFEAIEKIARTEAKKLLQEVSLFDVYRGDKLEAGKKSYAVSFIFQHAEKTLTDAEIDKVMTRLMSRYERELGAIIRKG